MRRWSLLTILLAFGVLPGCYAHLVLLDTDNNPNTGCSVPINDDNYSGTAQGIDRALWTGVVSSEFLGTAPPGQIGNFDPNDPNTPFAVVGTAVVACDPNGVDPNDIELLNENVSAWPVGLNNGTNGADVIELSAPRSLLGASNEMRATFLSAFVFEFPGGLPETILQDSSAAIGLLDLPHTTDVSPASNQGFLIQLVPTSLAPTMSLGMLAALSIALLYFANRRLSGFARGAASLMLVASLAGIAYATTIYVDGQIPDWTGIAPLGTDPDGDSSSGDPAEDIVAVFATSDQQNVYFRIDIADVEAGHYYSSVP